MVSELSDGWNFSGTGQVRRELSSMKVMSIGTIWLEGRFYKDDILRIPVSVSCDFLRIRGI